MMQAFGYDLQVPLLILDQQDNGAIVRLSTKIIPSREDGCQLPTVHDLKALGHELMTAQDELDAIAIAEARSHILREGVDTSTSGAEVHPAGHTLVSIRGI